MDKPLLPSPSQLADVPIADRISVQTLISLYNHAIDGGYPDAVAACFVEDGVFEGRSGRFVGRAELRKLGMTAGPALFPRHVVSNIIIWPDDDKLSLRVRSHLFYYEINPQGFYLKTSGVYDDVVTRQGDLTFLFRTRRMTLDVATNA